MDNILFSFGVVMPLFLTMVIGFGIKQFKLADAHFFSVANNVCFKVLLPLMIFNNLYTSNIEDIFDIKLIVFCVVSVIALTLLCLLIVPIFVKENAKRGVMVQGMFRSNYLLYGLPLITELSDSAGVAILSMLIVIIIPVFNVLAVVVLALFQSEGNKRPSAKTIIKNIFKNPLIIGSIIAVAAFLLKIQLPVFLEKTISSVASIATPLSLIILGGEFNFKNVGHTLKHTAITLFVRLIAAPAVIIFLAIQFGFSGASLCVILTLFACPVAVSSYVMAKNSGGDCDLAVNLVVFSTLFSSVTIFFFVLILRSLGYI
ncbi:MAG: AEC family transporter [Oscillospiraceae bacterium]|nr:AEC family transporter [Oscillospiraceae bacterium]